MTSKEKHNLSSFFENILAVYQSKKSFTEKWLEIATSFNEHQESIVKIFNYYRKNNLLKETSLNYTSEIKDILSLLKDEKDELLIFSLQVSVLHQIVYYLMQQKENHLFMLEGNNEMAVLTDNINYYINISKKNEQNIFFHAYILTIALESLMTKNFYVCIDFEYTLRKIKLAQLNFEHPVVSQSMIFIVSPPELEETMMNNFIDLIMCNYHINKIFHGADSQDLPYVYNQMLQDNAKKITKFTRNFIDTRYLCEYYKMNKEGEINNKCSIYDEDKDRSAIYYFKLISEKQQDNLKNILESMPNHNDIEWNIHKMSEPQVLYAQYDVLFLKYFYYRIINMATDDVADNIGKKNIIELYKNVIGELVRFNFLEKQNVTFLKNKCKEEVDPINNYFIKKQNSIIKLVDVFNKVYLDIVTSDPVVEVNKLLVVSSFKLSIMLILKRMVYGHLSRLCKIQKDKTSSWNEKLPNDFIMDFFQQVKFPHLASMFKDINKILEFRIKTFCSQN